MLQQNNELTHNASVNKVAQSGTGKCFGARTWAPLSDAAKSKTFSNMRNMQIWQGFSLDSQLKLKQRIIFHSSVTSRIDWQHSLQVYMSEEGKTPRCGPGFNQRETSLFKPKLRPLLIGQLRNRLTKTAHVLSRIQLKSQEIPLNRQFVQMDLFMLWPLNPSLPRWNPVNFLLNA